MKNIPGILVVIIWIFLIHSCKKDNMPAIITTDVTEISYTTATSGGEVTNDGGAPVIAMGVCWDTSAEPTISNSKTTESSLSGGFKSNITQLTPNTIYYVRAYATNRTGTGYGNQVSFTTSRVDVPVLTTAVITSITQTNAVSGGNISAENGGSVTSRGVCWGTAPNPATTNNITIDGTGTGSFVSKLTGLQPGTTYYVRSYATNSEGTAYGDEIIFQTPIYVNVIIFNPDLTYGTVTDIDGNSYKTITIGTQTWMAENLKTTKYRNGDSIESQWAYNGNESYVAVYGRLYTWYAATDNRNICPTGWYVPSSAEWIKLGEFIGGSAFRHLPGILGPCPIAGGRMKESGTTHWSSPNMGGTNTSGFTALPGGKRGVESGTSFSGLGNVAWWLSSTAGGGCPYIFIIDNSNDYLYRNNNAYRVESGFSVRCVMAYLPTVSTTAVSTYTSNSAIAGGNASSIVVAVTERGVYWGTSQNPETTGTKLQIGSGTGSFSASLPGLNPNTTYYVKAYATNSSGTSYGNEINFTTDPAKVPTLTTSAVSSIAQTTATCGGNVTSDCGAPVTARGVCWSTSENPAISDSRTTNGTGTGEFISLITGLTLGETYYVRAYATNSEGTSYGNEINFTTTTPTAPPITTTAISSIKSTAAKSGGNVTNDGGAIVTARGVCWSTSAHPTIANSKTIDGTGTGTFTSSITGLILGDTYYLRAYATNSLGTSYGNEINFTTKFAIGESYQGGNLAYILQPGDPGYTDGEIHGLIAAPSDQSRVEWGCYRTTISGADGTAIGTGNQNTMDILKDCSEADRAAKICYDLELNSYSDWYLPGKDELNKLYINKGAIGGFQKYGDYWSSTESSSSHAWLQSFDTGEQISYFKYFPGLVRAIRSF